MTIYSVQGPDGRIYDIEGPEGASEGDVIAALQQHLSPEVSAPKAKPKTGFMPALRSGIENLKGDVYAGLAGLGVEGSEAKARAQKEKAAALYQQPEFLEHPVDYVTGLLGQSVPYMAAPLVAGAAAYPLGALAATGAAGAASAAQFTGSNLSRQLDEGKTGAQLETGKAFAAALPQAALDVIGFKYVPGIRTLFSKAGIPITEEAAKGIAGRYILPAAKTAGVEGATEAGQQVFERLQAGLNLTDPEARKEYFDNFLGGAVLGGTLAVPGTMLEGRRKLEQAAAPEVVEAPERERGEITSIPPTERGEIGVGKYTAPETPPTAAAPTPQEAIQLGYTKYPEPSVIDLMDQYATAHPRMETLQDQIRAAAVAGDTAKAKELYAQLKEQRESLGGLKTQIEQLGGVAQTADEFAKTSAASMGALDKKLKTAQKALSDAGELGEFDKIPKLAEKLEKLQAERDELQATQARHNELLRIQGTPKGETIPLFAADEAQPTSTEVLNIPYDTVEFAGEGQPLRKSSGQASVINYGGRMMTMRNVNGVMVPFYLSTGAGGKTDVPAGKWYPFFGIGSDGWINKTGGKEMSSYYGSNELKEAAEKLDQTVGDIREDTSIPKASTAGKHVDFINQGLTPSENGQANTAEKVQQNIEKIKTAVAKNKAVKETGDKDIAAKEAEAERKAGELVELVKAGPKPAAAEDKAKILAELNTAREKYRELQAVRVQSDLLEENKASMRRRITDLENQLASTTKSATQEGHIDFVNKESEKLNKLYDELDALRGGKPAPTESSLALFQRDNLLRTAIANDDKKTVDILTRAQKEADQRAQRGMSEKDVRTERMQQRLDLPGTVVERVVNDEEYDSIMDKIEVQLNKINKKQGNAKESYAQKAERLLKEMSTFEAAAENKEATAHQRAMARRTYNAKLKEYETIVNGHITPAQKEMEALYKQLYTKKEVASASEIAQAEQKEVDRTGREKKELSKEAKKAKSFNVLPEQVAEEKTEEGKKANQQKIGKGIKAAPERVARELGYDTEEYQKLATAAQKKIDTKVAQYNTFVTKAKQQLEKLKGKKGDPEKAEVMRKEMEAAKNVAENNPDDATLRRKYNAKKDQYEAFTTGSTVSAAYKAKEAAVIKAANEKLNALNVFKQSVADALDAKAEALGRAAPEMRSALLAATKERKKAAAETEQPIKSKRTVQETRKVAKLGTMSTGTPESQARSAARQTAFEENVIKPEAQARVEKAIKDVNKAPSEAKGSAMKTAFTKAAQKKSEEGKFARGVEVESPDLTPEQIKHLENNNVLAALATIAKDDKAHPVNRAVAEALRGVLDNTRVELHNRLYDDKGKEVLGEAISTRIKLSRAGGLSQEVLLHEGTHAAVERTIQLALEDISQLNPTQQAAFKELRAIYNRVKADPSITSTNAKGSISEFAAEVFSNRNLQEQLRKKPWRMSNMLREFVSVVLRLLGVKDAQTMLGASLHAVDLLMMPTSAANTRVETPVNRQYSAKDIAALETGSNSMRVFAEQFGPEIKQKDRTPEDVERLASVYLSKIELRPQDYVAQATPDKLDYKTGATMSDGTLYDENNPLHFVEADMAHLVSHEAINNPKLRTDEATAINDERNNALFDLAVYLNDNPDYTLAEQALVAKAASKYGVTADKEGRLKVVNISDNNRHPVAVVGRDSANAVIEELRKGKSLKDAFIEGMQTVADRNAKENKTKQGWQKFEQSDKYEDAVALNAGAAGTPWCTGASMGHAESQLGRGDFYIYYDKGRPEVAIRMDGQNRIGEVRGNLPNQALSKEHQQLAKTFMLDKQFDGSKSYIDEFERKEALIKLFSNKPLDVEDFFVFGKILTFGSDVNEKDVKSFLKFKHTFSYGKREIPDTVVAGAVKKIETQIQKIFADGYFLNKGVHVSSSTDLDREITTTAAGKEFTVKLKDVKALSSLLLNTNVEITLPALRSVGRLEAFNNANFSAPKIKKIDDLVVFEDDIVLSIGDGAYIAKIRPASTAKEKPFSMVINGKVSVGQINLNTAGAALNASLPDVETIGVINEPSSFFEKAAPDMVLYETKHTLRAAGFTTDLLHADFIDRDDTLVQEAADSINGSLAAINDYFGTRAIQKYFKTLEKDPSSPHEALAIDDVINGFITEQYSKVKNDAELIALNKKINKVLVAINPETKEFITEHVGSLRAPNRVMAADFKQVQERPRYAPKDVGVQEDKPGIFSFKSARQEASIAPSFVAKNPTEVDRLRANFLGLAGRVQFVDKDAALSEALKKGVDSNQITSLEAEQGEYYLRFGQQRSQYAGQFLTNGPVSLVGQETERGKKIGKKEFIYQSTPGANMMQVADALAPSKIGNDTEKEAMLTALLAGERAKQVGWAKLNFENPAKVEQEYNQVKALLNSRPQDKAMFDNAMKIYKEYNAGLLDFLVQTGTMTEKKAAELKALTYVPFYRVNKGTGEIELMVDKEHPVRIGNIKDEPQLKELVGDSTEILPIFTSAVQNTFMLTDMALRNQMVKENAFMLNKIGIASTIGQGAGPASPDTVRFKHKGEDHFVVIDTDLYGIPASLIVKGMEGIKTTMPAAIRMLGMPADILRKFVTRNPAYAIKQAIRDPLTAWMTTGTDGIPVLNGLKELSSMVAGRSDAEKKLMASGAISSNVFTGDKGDMEKFLKEISMGRSGWQKLMARADAFALQGDAATRAVIYRDSLNKGMSEMQAMLRTLESMNFSRRGLSPSMQMASVLIPFFNAQIQGLDVLYRAFKGDMPYSQQLEIRKKMMARGLLLAAGTIAYAAMMEDDEAYKNAKPEERLGNWFLPTPFSDEPLRIPVPFELGYLFKSLPEAVYNMAAADERNSDITKGMGKLVMQSNPFSLPQAIKPATEAYLGRSFFGGDIESQREIHGMVPTERYRTTTTEIAKMMGSITGEANISPIKLDYLIRGYTGGLGIALISLANPLLNTETAETPTKKTSQLPFVGGLFQPIEGRGTLDAAYARMLEVQQAKGTYDSLMQRGKREEAREFRDEYIDKISSASVSGTVQQKLGELAKMKRMVQSSPTLSTERKDELIKRLETQQNNLAERFLQISDRTTRQAAQT